MNKRQNSKFNMYNQTELNISKADPAITSALPMFNLWFDSFKNIVATFNMHLEIQIAQTGGLQKDKADILQNLIIAANNLSLIIQSYATAIDDLELNANMSYNKSALSRKSALSLIAAANLIAAAANQHLADLAPYDVTPLTMLEYFNLTLSFTNAYPQPTAAKLKKSGATLAIKNVITQADSYLKKMDGVIRTVQLKHPIFTAAYFLARKINNPQQNIMAARGQITNPAGEPMPFVQITSKSLKLNRRATKNGRFGLRNAKPGQHKITFYFPGYKPITQTITVTTGLRAEVKVILIPI